MTVLHSIIFGIVEGVTEFLPISSTGHLILTAELLRVPQTVFTKSFEIIIQLGAIASVVFLYWKRLWNVELIKKLAVAFVPTGIIGLALYKIVKTYLIGNDIVVLWALLIGGVALIIFESRYANRDDMSLVSDMSAISYRTAFIIGLFQSIAIIPGVSRSAATIVGGLSLGLSRRTIVEFSFLLAVPTMIAASGLDILKNYSSFSAGDIGVLSFGFLVSFLVAILSIRFLLQYIGKHSFTAFGWYRVVIAVIFWFFML